jgi:hypothetical protein
MTIPSATTHGQGRLCWVSQWSTPAWGILLVVRKNYGNGIFVGDDYTMPICRDLAPFLLGNISRLVNSDV